MNSTLSMAGPIFTYDTRDSATQPHRGLFVTGTWLFGFAALGDSYRHNKVSLAGSAYFPFGGDTVLATNATFCAAHGDVPYFDLCRFGSNSALRGYPAGRYRDRASWAVQGEIRHSFARRWGGAAFFGLGGIAPSPGKFVEQGNLLPAAGIGLRYRPFHDNDINLRVDVAKGKNSSGVYLSIGEAF